jgi:hypothetical protein
VSEDEHFNERFWSDSTLWPEDTPGYIFLTRAMQRLEGLIYPEPLMAPPKFGSDSDDEEAAAIEDAFEIYKAMKVIRRSEIMSRFITACRSGTLACATRPKPGGQFTKLEQAIWNSERCHHWFLCCDISLQAPYDTDEESNWSTTKQWLFVTNESLARFTAPALGAPPSHTSRHLSPYVRLMIDVIDDLGITPTNQPNLESLKKEFTDRWLKLVNEELSDRLAHGMASLVRDPESQGGRDKSRSKNKK